MSQFLVCYGHAIMCVLTPILVPVAMPTFRAGAAAAEGRGSASGGNYAR